MGNRITRTVLFAASALLYISAFGAGAARFGTLRNSDWVVTNAWQAVSNKTHDLILEIGQGGSLPPDWQNVSNAAMNAVQSLQPAYDYTDNALISFSSTGSIFRSLSYGTATRWTDATGCVWEVAIDSQWSVVTTNLVGRVALTNDIPTVDYTTNNSQLVATIESTAPAPGDYSAVSNAAMSARSATDLGVRGYPTWKGTFFTVNGEVCIFDEGDAGWSSQNFYISGYPPEYSFQLKEGVEQIWFVLSNNYSAIITNYPGYVIIGYTNMLAQVSQIPSLSDFQPFDFSDMRGVFLSISNIIHVLGGSVTNFPTFNQ